MLVLWKADARYLRPDATGGRGSSRRLVWMTSLEQ